MTFQIDSRPVFAAATYSYRIVPKYLFRIEPFCLASGKLKGGIVPDFLLREGKKRNYLPADYHYPAGNFHQLPGECLLPAGWLKIAAG